jgi:hypothetical protein
VIGCEVVDGLWGRLDATLVRLDGRMVTMRERVLGLKGQGDAVRLRNRLGFTLRSAVLRARGAEFINSERAEGLIWAAFLFRLKRELVQGVWLAKSGGDMGRFSREVLVGGVLGGLGGDGEVEWEDLVGKVRVPYWELYQ